MLGHLLAQNFYARCNQKTAAKRLSTTRTGLQKWTKQAKIAVPTKSEPGKEQVVAMKAEVDRVACWFDYDMFDNPHCSPYVGV